MTIDALDLRIRAIRARIKAQVALVDRFDPSQPRDDQGRWTDSGGGGDADVTAVVDNKHPLPTQSLIVQPYNDKQTFELLINPTSAMAVGLLKDYKKRPDYYEGTAALRTLVDGRQNVYISLAADAIHQHMIDALHNLAADQGVAFEEDFVGEGEIFENDANYHERLSSLIELGQKTAARARSESARQAAMLVLGGHSRR